MEVICCSNTTKLLSFPELKPIISYQHPEQNVPSSISGFKINCFQRLNKTSDPKCQNIEYFKLKKDLKGTSEYN